MSKFLRGASKVLGAIAVVASFINPGIAAIAALASQAASIGAQLTARPPARPGVETEFRIATQGPIPYVIGRTQTGGSVVHRRSYTIVDDNPWQTFIVVLSGAGPIEDIEGYTMNGSPVTFTGGSYGGGNAVGHYHDFMYMGAQLGQVPEATQLVGNAPGFPDWTAAHKLSGFAAASWTLKFDSDGKKYGSGEPEPGFIVKGVRVYDPRLDSTYPGGAGACRALNEATYVYSENPALHALTWALGRIQNGKRALGVGIPAAQIITPTFIDAANTHDSNGWKVGGVIDASRGKWNNTKLMLEAGAAEPVDLGGMLACFHERPRVSLATITNDDLADGAIILPGMRSKRERINTMIPNFRSEAHNWKYIDADPVINATAVTEDGESRTRPREFTLVQDKDQVSQLAAYAIATAREVEGISLSLKMKWVGYQAGDCVTINLPDEGVNNLKVIIQRRSIDPVMGTINMVFRTETDAKHAFALGQTGTAPPSATVISGEVSDGVVSANVTSVIGATVLPGTGLTSTVDPVTGTVTFDSGSAGALMSLTATAPLVRGGTSTAPVISITAATITDAGSMSAGDKTKLNGVQVGATANSTDGFLINRANHSGTDVAPSATGIATFERITATQLSQMNAVRATGNTLTGATGAGAELLYDGSNAILQAYNRTSATYFAMLVDATTITFRTSGTSRAQVSATGLNVSSGNLTLTAAAGAIGYGTGAGGVVTQLTSKATGVTLNRPSGAITMNGAALVMMKAVSFTLTNSVIAASDTVNAVIKSGATAGAYTVTVDAVAAGTCQFTLRNHTAVTLSEAVVINFAILKGATS